jgi:hypothetical protein
MSSRILTKVEAHNLASDDIILFDGLEREVISVDRRGRRVYIEVADDMGDSLEAIEVPAHRTFDHVGYSWS